MATGFYFNDPDYKIAKKVEIHDKAAFNNATNKTTGTYFKLFEYGLRLDKTEYFLKSGARTYWANKLLDTGKLSTDGYFSSKKGSRTKIPFTDKRSARVPVFSGSTVPFKTILTINAGETAYLRYHKDTASGINGRCEYRKEGGGWNVLSGKAADSTNLFIMLQGGGGGACGSWMWRDVFNGNGSGGGGGGGGAYVDGVLDLSAYPNEEFKITVGWGGSAGVSSYMYASSGQNGGDTVLSFKGTVLACAGGGKAGYTMTFYNGQGGPGGSYSYNDTSYFYTYNLCGGGYGGFGNKSGWSFFVPWAKPAAATNGDSVSYSLRAGPKNEYQSHYSNGCSATGDQGYNYTANGGGGGAAICSNWRSGYGAGGSGPTADLHGCHDFGDQNGLNGVAFIAELEDISNT